MMGSVPFITDGTFNFAMICIVLPFFTKHTKLEAAENNLCHFAHISKWQPGDAECHTLLRCKPAAVCLGADMDRDAVRDAVRNRGECRRRGDGDIAPLYLSYNVSPL